MKIQPEIIPIERYIAIDIHKEYVMIGDISRFPSAKKLAGYAGLGAGVHISGKKYQEKSITTPKARTATRSQRTPLGDG